MTAARPEGTPLERQLTMTEAALRRSAFLAEASSVLAASLDYETTLHRIAQLVVPELADWCIIDVLEEAGDVRRVEVAHSDPDLLALALEFSRRYQGNPGDNSAALEVIRSGEPRLVSEITDAMLSAAADDTDRLELWRQLGLRSYMCVPLTAHGRTRGAITLVSSQPGRLFGADDLALAQNLAQRVAIAVDNARLYQELQEAIKTRDEFLSSVSHDLKNPIAAIKGRAQMIQRRIRSLELDERERIDKGLEAIDVAATRMSRIINDLVDLARLRGGQPLDLARTQVDLVELARSVAAEQQHLAGSRPIQIVAEAEQIEGRWDSVRLHRVLTNLLSNAIKYSPEGGDISVQICCRKRPEGDVALMTVRDRGIGIPSGDLEYIFERYHRGANVSGRYEGTGVGLAVARQIVEQHGGRICVESVEGEGSTFTLELPLSGAEE